MSKLKKGDPVPVISLKNQHGELIQLNNYAKGKSLVVYFYPKDDTPGCTAQACTFRDQYEDFEDVGAVVVGISGDSVSSHKKFAERNDLHFTLLSDRNRAAEKAFGVPRSFLGLLPGRVTYIFNPSGKLVGTFNSAVQAKRHIQEALNTLEKA